MSGPSSDVNPLDALAEEFVARCRAGERPSLDEFIARRPDLEKDIRDLFPGLVLMEGVRPERGETTGPFAPGPAPALMRLGDFRVLREVGRGGMGIVYEAEQESLGRHVALKVLPAHALLDPQRLRRFQREAKAAARLHHTNIVPVYGVGEQDGLHYYVMQFIQGQGLDQVLDELKQLRQSRKGTTTLPRPADRDGAEAAARSLLTGRFAPSAAAEDPRGPDAPSPPEAVAPADGAAPKPSDSSVRSDTGRAYWESVARVGVQAAQALAYAAAQGTLHRDVKPSNLLLDAHGNLWVTDFGLAKAADGEDLTHTGDIVGTLRYMAPERFSGRGDLRSDLYSLGLTLYELLALRPAFDVPDRQQLVQQVLHAEPPRLRQLDRAVPRDLETIVHKAVDKDPARRYQTGQEMADDLQRFLDDRPIRARRVGAAERAWRWCRRNPAVAGLSAALALVLVGSFVAAIATAYYDSEAARHEAALAADERKARADADAARKQADDNAARLRDNMARLYEVNALMESGRRHAALNEREKAHADLTKAVERMPEYALVWRERCELYYRLGLEEEALADGARVFELKEPEEPEAWFHYAGLRLQQGDAAGYRAVCARMQEKFGRDDKADPIWLSLACCLGPDALPAPSDALVRRMETAVNANPNDWPTRAVLALVLYRAGRLDEAAGRLTDVGDPNGILSVGSMLAWEVGALTDHARGRDDRAKRLLQEVDELLERLNTNLRPFDASGDERWLLVEQQEGESLYREAAEAVRGAGSKEPPGAWERRARGHERIGRKGRAADDLTRALRQKPDAPDLLVWRARLYADSDQKDRSDAGLARFVALKPPEAHLWADACEVPAAREDWDAAADLACRALEALGDQAANFDGYLGNHGAVLSRVARRRPDDFRLRLGVANVFVTNGHRPAAVEWVTEALRVKPDDAGALSARANLHAELGRWRDAAEDFDHLLKVRPPRTASDLLPLALLRAYLDDRDGYRDVCRQAVKQFGKDENPDAIWVVPEVLALSPNDIADPVQTQQRLAPLVVEKQNNPARVATYALACVRAGKAEEVVQTFGPGGLRKAEEPAERLALSLAYHRLGQEARARDRLSEADQVVEQRTKPYAGDDQAKLVQAMGWVEALRFLLLRREADALVNAPDRLAAEECLRKKQWKEAVEHLDALLKNDPAFWPDLAARGVAYAALRDRQKADADLKKALDLRPNGPYLWWACGRLNAEAGRWDDAANDFGEVLSPTRFSNDVRKQTYAELAQDEPLLLAVAARRPNDRDLRLNCGRLLEQQGKWKTALTLYGEAARLEGPDDKKCAASHEHGRLAVEHEQWADAAADFGALWERERSNAQLGHQAALLSLQIGDRYSYPQICQSLQKYLEAKPSSKDTRMWFLWSCMFGPDAVADFDPLIKQAEDKDVLADEFGPVQLAALYYRAGKFKEAEQLFDSKRMQADPVTPRYAVVGWLFRAMTYRRVGRTKDGYFWLEKATDWMGDAEQAKLPQGSKMGDWSWDARLELSLLRREAEAQLKQPAPKPEK
jgi:serine/threonine protein kinase/Tfp pilus assembly protein PilF